MDIYPIDHANLLSTYLAGIAGERLDSARAYCIDLHPMFVEALIYQDFHDASTYTFLVHDFGTPLAYGIECEEGHTPTDDDIDAVLDHWMIDRLTLGE